MKNFIYSLVAIVMTTGSADSKNEADRILFDFAEPVAGAAWTAVNDGVMGGRSQGGPSLQNGVLQFSGRLSLENNGGFSSLRRDIDMNLAGFTGIRIRVKGDGRAYQLRLQTDSRYAGRPVAYSVVFPTSDNEWIEIELPFEDLRAGFRGRSLTGYTFDPANIERIGLMLADKQAGPFSMDVQWIQAYR